jgi:hypothetical protein
MHSPLLLLLQVLCEKGIMEEVVAQWKAEGSSRRATRQQAAAQASQGGQVTEQGAADDDVRVARSFLPVVPGR